MCRLYCKSQKHIQGPLQHLSGWPFMSELCCIRQRVIDVLGQLAPPSFLVAFLPLSMPSATASHRWKSVRVLGPSGLMSISRGGGGHRGEPSGQNTVRRSGTPVWLCDPSTDKPLFHFKLLFHSPREWDSYAGVCSGRAQGWAMSNLLIWKI